MKRVLAAALSVLLVLSLCGCDRGPEFVNPVVDDPGYVTFAYDDFSFSYPVSYTVTAKEGYLLNGSVDEQGKQAFGVTAETATLNSASSVTEKVVERLCESIIESSLPSYTAAAERYDASVSADDFSYTIDSLEYPVFGAEPGAKAFYTVRFENEAFAAVSMSFCTVWVFDESVLYVVTFCDSTGSQAKESFADCLDYIFCA